MINENQINTAQVNNGDALNILLELSGSEELGGSGNQEASISFDGFKIEGVNFIVDTLELDSGAQIDFDTFSVPRSDGEGVNGFYRRRKPIAVGGMIVAETVEALAVVLHNLKTKVFDKSQKWLQIKDNGLEARYLATLDRQTSVVRRGDLITMRRFDFNFSVLPGSGEELGYQSSSLSGFSDLEFTQQLLNGGQTSTRPIFIFQFSEATNLTRVTIENETTGEKVQFDFSSSINSGDVLRLDCANTLFELNGQEIDYKGPPPFLQTDVNLVKITLDADSAMFDLTTKYKNRYL